MIPRSSGVCEIINRSMEQTPVESTHVYGKVKFVGSRMLRLSSKMAKKGTNLSLIYIYIHVYARYGQVKFVGRRELRLDSKRATEDMNPSMLSDFFILYCAITEVIIVSPSNGYDSSK
ncbi:hypothetical protein CDAR_69721 [Caerostris darwini]|uniref:Uncharacterized protein n=1 Tax=Caerostris darwini TaxID=1538125 RepID=A0AAV4U0S5_9ARAC|nr:hypothetical protein CDAR_69721 [Caerostris darwini]